MRKIDRVFIHCSASDHPHHDDVSVIRKWHIEERGWSDVGYHYFIRSTGDVQLGRPIDKTPAAQRHHNTGTIAICLHGNDHFTDKQFNALYELCRKLDDQYGPLTFHGHKEVDKGKTCPNFDYKSVLRLNLEGYMRYAKIPQVFIEANKPSVWGRIASWLDELGEKK
jgi:N-acetylmuramoyl-L-alanine amidase